MTADRPLLVLLEDNHLCRADAVKAISALIPGSVIKTYATEHGFREALPEFQLEQPDGFVIDRRVRWTDPVPDMPIPPVDVLKGGFSEAGERSVSLIREAGLMAPVFIWSIDDSPFPDLPGVHFVNKTQLDELDSSRVLAAQIRNTITQTR